MNSKSSSIIVLLLIGLLSLVLADVKYDYCSLQHSQQVLERLDYEVIPLF